MDAFELKLSDWLVFVLADYSGRTWLTLVSDLELGQGSPALAFHRPDVQLVDHAIHVDILAKVRRVGRLAQIGLNESKVSLGDRPIAVDITHQETHRDRGRREGVRLVVLHVSEGNYDVFSIAFDPLVD